MVMTDRQKHALRRKRIDEQRHVCREPEWVLVCAAVLVAVALVVLVASRVL